MLIDGHHHISMYTKHAKQNVMFYRDYLGLRFVKKTVNQDSYDMYHLFYGDTTGSPGTELTFFEMPYLGHTYRGTNAITKIGLLIEHEQSLDYWKDRFKQLGVPHGDVLTYHGRLALPFEDPDGLQLQLIVNQDEQLPPFWQKWEKSPVPLEHHILGMGPVELTVQYLDKTKDVLTTLLGYSVITANETESIFQSVRGAPYSEIVVKQLDGVKAKPGRGSVHHLAIRVKNKEELEKWDERIKAYGLRTTGVIDRHYFHSLYFRDLNGIHYELATDGPGFNVDETVDELGTTLSLPPFLEDKREEIKATLKPIDV